MTASWPGAMRALDCVIDSIVGTFVTGAALAGLASGSNAADAIPAMATAHDSLRTVVDHTGNTRQAGGVM